MFWPFTRKSAKPDDARMAALERLCAALAEEMAEERAKAFAFRGRVYAYLGKKGVKLSEEDADVEKKSDELPLDDPRLTKAQVKQRLGLITPAGQARRLKHN